MSRNRLLLMRHAKSDWSHPGLSDKQRPLNARGRSAAPRMARWLLENKAMPTIVLSSTAVRTKETLELMQGIWESAPSEPTSVLPQVQWIDELYLAPANTMLAIASEYRTHPSIMILAHNPGTEDLASYLAKRECVMPTAAIALLEAIDDRWPTNWLDVNSWEWRGLVKPRDLGEDSE